MQRASPDDRIAQLEAELIAKDQRISALLAESASKDGRIATLEQQVANLMKQGAQLSEQLGKIRAIRICRRRATRRMSESKRRNKAKKDKQRRKRGAQPAHQGAHRELLPAEKVNKFVDLFPKECVRAASTGRARRTWRARSRYPHSAHG